MMAWFTDAYMCHWVSRIKRNRILGHFAQWNWTANILLMSVEQHDNFLVIFALIRVFIHYTSFTYCFPLSWVYSEIAFYTQYFLLSYSIYVLSTPSCNCFVTDYQKVGLRFRHTITSPSNVRLRAESISIYLFHNTNFVRYWDLMTGTVSSLYYDRLWKWRLQQRRVASMPWYICQDQETFASWLPISPINITDIALGCSIQQFMSLLAWSLTCCESRDISLLSWFSGAINSILFRLLVLPILAVWLSQPQRWLFVTLNLHGRIAPV